MPNYAGGCACKSVRFECSADPVRTFNCHCTHCQRATGSGYAPLLVFSRDAVKLTGDIKYYSWTGNSGRVVKRGFCPTCGNPIFAVGANPTVCFLYAPSLDDPKLYKPENQIFTRSAQPWDKFDQTIACYEKGPGQRKSRTEADDRPVLNTLKQFSAGYDEYFADAKELFASCK